MINFNTLEENIEYLEKLEDDYRKELDNIEFVPQNLIEHQVKSFGREWSEIKSDRIKHLNKQLKVVRRELKSLRKVL